MDDRIWRRLKSQATLLPDPPGDESTSDRQAGSSRATGRSLLTFAELSALIAVLAGLTYVLGLLALYFPIARTYNHDFVTAWYEVALVPKPVVAGHGVKELLGLPSLLVLALIVFTMGTRLVLNYVDERLGEKWVRISVRLVQLGALALISVYLYLLLRRHDFDVADTFRSSDVPLFVLLVTSVVYFLVAFLSLRLLRLGVDLSKGPTVPRIINLKYVVGSVLIIFADFFVLGFLMAAYKDPPLPKVEIRGSVEVEGALLAHNERFWYAIVKDGDLISISDDAVTSVRVFPEKDSNPTKDSKRDKDREPRHDGASQP